MKYTVSIEIAMPREEVAQLLADPAHLPKWLRGLVLHKPLSGVHGQLGTKSRVVMQTGQQKFEATETITRREPADLHGIPKGSVVHFEREIVGEGMWNAARETRPIVWWQEPSKPIGINPCENFKKPKSSSNNNAATTPYNSPMSHDSA